MDAYLAHLRRVNSSPRTVNDYRSLLGFFTDWLAESGIESPLHVTQEQLEHFQSHVAAENRRQSAALANFVKVLRSFYRWLEQERLILRNPAERLRYPKKQKRIHRDVLTPDEVTRLLDQPDAGTALGLRDAVLLRLMAFSGLRVSEACGLDVNSVNLKERELVVRQGKGRKDRLAFFDVDTQAVLARYLVQARPRLAKGNESALLVGDKGSHLRPWRTEQMVRRCAAAARLAKRITPHSLRRTFATLLLHGGCNLKVIADLMGHDRLSTTANYQKLDIADLSRVYKQAHPLAGDDA